MENKRKIITVDMDGTLLNDEHLLSSYTKEILQKLSAMGHIVVLNSGRPYRSMKGYYEDLGLKSPIIVYNGAYIFNPSDESFPPLRLSFKKEAIKEIYEASKEMTTSFMCESDATIYSDVYDPHLDRFFWYKGMEHRLGEVYKTLDVDPMTCIFKAEHQFDDKIIAIISKYKHLNFGYRHWTDSLYAELYLTNASKEEGLLYIMKEMDVDKEDVIAFGDSDNDYGVLKVSGHPYTMKNCKSALLKESFPATEFSNNEDGVAKELAKIFLL
ncbi:MAG: Cof-type HAD-IIB family hydrolase [Bacilli bacterium]|nr:Cof-type HAD-IIB family hydrolase [Bacilli bacterium]